MCYNQLARLGKGGKPWLKKRRKEQLMKRRERRLTALCIGGGIGAMLLSLFVCMMIFDIRPDGHPFPRP